MEIESPAPGYVRRILLPADRTAPVATVIALLSDTADEPLPSLSEVLPSAAENVASVATATPPVAEATPSLAASLPASDGERVRSSPAARKRAQELGVDIAAVRGTGPGGRINIEDVEAAATARTSPAHTNGV